MSTFASLCSPMNIAHHPSLTHPPPRKFQKVLRGFWCLVFLVCASVLGVFFVCVIFGVFTFIGCLLWSLNLLMRVPKQNSWYQDSKSTYLGGRMNIILQKQLSKSVQICKLFSRLEVFLPVSFFGVGGGRA